MGSAFILFRVPLKEFQPAAHMSARLVVALAKAPPFLAPFVSRRFPSRSNHWPCHSFLRMYLFPFLSIPSSSRNPQ